MLQAPQVDFENSSPRSKGLWIAITLALWLGTTWVFWVGYAGYDDQFYACYAFRFDRPPISWWEFRIPMILAIRASFLAFGPSEIAACLPTLLASLAILASVAWFVDWPRRLNWQTQASVILASVIPLEAGSRSDPCASHLSAGFLAVGTVCMLKGVGRTRYLGAPLLAIGFLTHEVSFYCVAMICLVALAFDWRRFWGPVLACVAVSGCAFLAECLAYQVLLGDPLARFRMAAQSNLGSMTVGYDPDVGIGGWDFYAWPIKNLFFCKCFGFDLIALLVTGIVAWKRLSTEQRVLFASTFLIWLWLGYGTLVPWEYKPLYRQFSYYQPLTLGIAALLPGTLRCALAPGEARPRGCRRGHPRPLGMFGRRGPMRAGGRRVSGAARVCPGAQRSDIPHGCGHDEPDVCGRGISVAGQRGLLEWPGRRSVPPREQPPREPRRTEVPLPGSADRQHPAQP